MKNHWHPLSDELSDSILLLDNALHVYNVARNSRADAVTQYLAAHDVIRLAQRQHNVLTAIANHASTLAGTLPSVPKQDK